MRYRASTCVNLLESDNPRLVNKTWASNLQEYGSKDEDFSTPEMAPQVLRSDKVKSMSDFFGGGAAVSERFKTLIESFEPDGHRFFEVSVRNEKGVEWPGRFFLWHLRLFIPCIEVDRSTMRWVRLEGVAARDVLGWWDGSDACVNTNQTKGHHVWGAHPGSISDIFCSDEFYRECKAQKIRFLTWYKCQETDEPWSPEGNEWPTEAQLNSEASRMG
ncbi:imm11 family protein [Rhodospira trueperi]|uniref:imm11 family protein n=1 Tax=Rhodospira trueperi TaxID=69960 RepID=UPI00115FD568|nr:DUF1629 domain-containing protein [Rhodospira trueperi]